MHTANFAFLQHCDTKYSNIISNASVIEFGSFNVNGTSRDILKNYNSWVGIDWRNGPCVDFTSLVHEATLGEFDVVISCSMLEHDPYWALSIPNMIKHLKPSGVMILAWGAANNPAHCEDTAPDGKHHRLPAGKVLHILKKHNIYLHEFWYEGNFIDSGHVSENGMGEVCLVAFKDKTIAIGESHIDELSIDDTYRLKLLL
jgi:SAM-dependent methyltransferase